MGLADRLRELADEAEAMEARLMPEGMEWPMVDGEPVVIGERLVGYGSGDDGYEVVGVRPTCGWVLVRSCDHIHRDEGPVILEWDASKCRRPAPKVLDADGVPLSEGETVYEVEGTGHAYKVVGIRVGDGDPLTPTVVTCDEGDGTSEHFLPSQLTHRAPVLAADGEPLEVGQTVWRDDGERLEVLYLRPDGLVDCCGEIERPERLTHQRPVLDADGVPIKVGDTVYFTDGREQKCNTVVNAKYGYKDEAYVQLGTLNEAGHPTYTNCSCIDPSQLTHTKPEIDSWERLEEDARELDISLDGENTSDYPRMSCVRDLVRRCKELARKENNNE